MDIKMDNKASFEYKSVSVYLKDDGSFYMSFMPEDGWRSYTKTLMIDAEKDKEDHIKYMIDVIFEATRQHIRSELRKIL